jgi:rare lipoprotein A
MRRIGRVAILLLAGASLAACATVAPQYSARAPHAARGHAQASVPGYKTGEPYQVGGIWYVPKDEPNYNRIGIASWYGDAFNMKATANGETFDMTAFSAAHTTLPLPSMVEVTNLDNGRKLVVRVNDRGPFVGNRIIDLSRAAATELGYDRKGLARVRVRYLGPAPLAGPRAGVRLAQSKPSKAPAMTLTAPVATPMTGASAPILVASTAPAASPVSVAPLAPLAPAPSVTEAIYHIQAGAFSDPARARRAQAKLAIAGEAVIETMEQNGVTLYRVVLPGPSDEAQAFALRDRVAQYGFTDARVVRPSSAF